MTIGKGLVTRGNKGSRVTTAEGDANWALLDKETGSIGASIASATTTDLNTATGQTVQITGTTTITSFGTAAPAGTIRVLRFAGALTLTNSANLVLPNSANILTVANDVAIFQYEGASVWRMIDFLPGDMRIIAKSVGFPSIVDIGDWSASTSAIDLRLGSRIKVRMTATVTTLTVTAPLAIGSTQVDIRQDTTGSRLLTMPSSFKWPANYGTADKTLSTAASSWDRLILDYDGTNYVAGLLKGIA